MSDSITDRITVIIGGHTMWPSPGGGGLLQCLCGLDMLVLSEWCAHVAEVIVEQLGLTQEWVAQTDGGADFIRFEYADILDVIERSPSAHVSTRYVTKWAAG